MGRIVKRSQDQSLDQGRTSIMWRVIIVMRIVILNINVRG